MEIPISVPGLGMGMEPIGGRSSTSSILVESKAVAVGDAKA